jgi:hypothetical protein
MESYAKQWRERCKPISNLKDLLFCYFSGFKIICIPHSDRPAQLIYNQYVKLFDTIQEVSAESREHRELAGMLFSSQELQQYLRVSFEHFCTNMEMPFNFLKAAERINPVAATYEDHIVHAATFFMKRISQVSGEELFNRYLAPLVASSILLNAVRRRLPCRCKQPSVYDQAM